MMTEVEQLPKQPLICHSCLYHNTKKCKLYDEVNQETIPASEVERGFCPFYEKRGYFDQQGRFVPTWLAEEIMNECHFSTMRDNGEIYAYEKGVYRNKGKVKIQELCQEKLGEKCKKHFVDETTEAVKRLSYQDRDEFFNDNTNLICVENGVLTLENGGFIEHSPKHRFLQKLPVKYDSNAECPQIEKALDEIMPDDTNQEAIIEWTGYCLLRNHPIHKAAMFVGDGENGKSVVLNLIGALLGKKNVSARSLQELENNRFAKAELFGKLANICPDIPDKAMKTTGTFKQLTGGDLVTAERKFQGGFEYHNTAKLLFSCNKVPEAYDESDAYFRRWNIITFTQKFEGDKADKHLLEKITTPKELSGFLNKAITGLRNLLERGDFINAKKTKQIREEYKRKSNPVWAFVQDCIDIKPEGFIEKKELYRRFKEYCEKKDYPAISDTSFHKKIQYEVRVEDYRPRLDDRTRAYCWRGIQFKEEE